MISIPSLTEILIAGGVGLAAAIAIRIFRARSAKRRNTPVYVHDALLKRAEAYTERSSFLKTVCRQYQANGRISDRQADAVAKAIARLEAVQPTSRRAG
ncbi:MAG: hypothetical protein A3D94_19570 [Alphaproteobacteria bacterium RIFCSPHIGHO2_12_FULL_66_14]|jgi:hypothetical protein|nr:MAG: hypothetical protein A3D94_19570 [Alphaproteobacteria bacterium RIFCSPHIGHO2_12_FULL_66_14]